MLRAANAAEIDTVTDGLRISSRVGDIATCKTDTELCAELQRRATGNMPDFIVIVASQPELPPCLLRYPDLRVLVLTTQRKVGSLTPWLQQGASDVASLARAPQMQHALGRIIDDSAMERRVNLLAAELERSEARYSSLVKNSRTALSYWRDDELIACSASFSDITGIFAGASTAQWLETLQQTSRSQFGDCLTKFPSSSRATVSGHGKTVRIARETLCDASDDNEHLFSVKLVLNSTDQSADTSADDPAVKSHAQSAARTATTKPASEPAAVVAQKASNNLSNAETDSASGLPARQSVVNDFQRWLQGATKNSRYVAMTIDLSNKSSENHGSENQQNKKSRVLSKTQKIEKSASNALNGDRTVQNLAVYRAADRLSRTLNSRTLMGRLNDDRLLIIRELEADEAPRVLAKGIRRSLGSLGGLLGSSEAVRINTVNISAKNGASAERLVTRLENR